MEIKKGWFFELEHDLYAGVNFVGVFTSKKEAEKGLEAYDKKNMEADHTIFWDKQFVSKCEYVEHNGIVYPLTDKTRSVEPEGE
jgi:hypothetical protein